MGPYRSSARVEPAKRRRSLGDSIVLLPVVLVALWPSVADLLRGVPIGAAGSAGITLAAAVSLAFLEDLRRRRARG